MALLEVGKGCGRGCRFCLEGQIYRPVRHRSPEALRESVAQIAKESTRVGLVGACVSDYPWIGELMKMLEEYGVEVSISSLRADSLTEDLVASLHRGGHRTLTMAPEAGTERLRRVIRKVITDEQLLAACDLLRKYGIPNLKCYFMIGQPTETMEDVLAIVDLARVERLGRLLHAAPSAGGRGLPLGPLRRGREEAGSAPRVAAGRARRARDGLRARMARVRAGSTTDVPPGEGRVVEAGGRTL